MSTSTHLFLALATFCVAIACKKDVDAPRGKRLASITEEEMEASLKFERSASITSPAPDPGVPAQPIIIGRRERATIDTSYSPRPERVSAVRPADDTTALPMNDAKKPRVERRTIDFHFDANGTPLFITNGADTLMVVPIGTRASIDPALIAS